MKTPRHVICAINDYQAGNFDCAMLHACIAIDATAKRYQPSIKGVANRYIRCLRDYYWLIEPMIGGGLNLDETRFSNIQLKKVATPDFAEIIYEIFRCNHAHGDEVPDEFSVVPSQGKILWNLAKGELHIPEQVLWALLSVVVFSKANAQQTSDGDHFLQSRDVRFLIKDNWGREDDIRLVVTPHNTIRVKMAGLELLQTNTPVEVLYMSEAEAAELLGDKYKATATGEE